jgi:hypothetical protein
MLFLDEILVILQLAFVFFHSLYQNLLLTSHHHDHGQKHVTLRQRDVFCNTGLTSHHTALSPIIPQALEMQCCTSTSSQVVVQHQLLASNK